MCLFVLVAQQNKNPLTILRITASILAAKSSQQQSNLFLLTVSSEASVGKLSVHIICGCIAHSSAVYSNFIGGKMISYICSVLAPGVYWQKSNIY